MIALQKAPAIPVSDELERMVARANRVSSYLKAFSHESRLLILCILAEGEKSVTELEHFLKQRQPTVSQQLARLRMDGLVTTRRSGKTIFYRLASDDIRTILNALYSVFLKDQSQRGFG